MKTFRAICVLVILVFASAELIASGPLGIYGIVEKVVFEPNEKSPERIQVWGAFAFVDGGVSRPGATSKPQRGYLYFSLPTGATQVDVKTEWTDLKAVAGTGQAVGFGNWGYSGPFSAVGTSEGRQTDLRVRPESESPSKPEGYYTNAGMVKLQEQGSHADIVKQLREALKAK